MKAILRIYWADLVGPVADSCEHGNEHRGFIKDDPQTSHEASFWVEVPFVPLKTRARNSLL